MKNTKSNSKGWHFDFIPVTKDESDKIGEQMKDGYEKVNAYFVPYGQNYELHQLTNALIQQSNDELFNITKSLGFMVDMGYGRTVFTPLSEIYNGYLDNAVTMLASGAFDYNTLIRKVVKEMTASGLRTVDYATGHSNRVDVAARRALLTGMGQLAGQISLMNGQARGMLRKHARQSGQRKKR